MIRTKTGILWLAGFFGISSICAASVTANYLHYITYDEAVDIALHDNVDLLALREQGAALKSQSKGALGPNEPVFSLSKVDIPSFSLTQKPAQTFYGVSWTLGFPGKALSQSAALRHQAEATAQQASAQEISIMTALSNGYVAFAINEEFYKFLLEEAHNNKDLVRLIEKRYAASQASRVDLLNQEVATQQIAQAILENRNEYQVLLTQFRQLIRRPSDTQLAPRVPDKFTIPLIKYTFEELVPIMQRNNQSIAAATNQAEGSQAMLTNASLQALPDFQLSAAINEWAIPGVAPNPGIGRDYTVGIGIVVPIFFPFNELQAIQSAHHMHAATEHQLSSVQLSAYSALQTAYTSLKAILTTLDASERLVVPAAKAGFDLTMLTYSYGKADYFMVSTSRKAWHDAERDMFTKRQNAAQLYNQLIAQMGCDIAKTEGPNACK